MNVQTDADLATGHSQLHSTRFSSYACLWLEIICSIVSFLQFTEL